MLLEKRLAVFKASLAEKNLIAPGQPSFRTKYYRLVFIRRALEFIISTLLFFGGQQFIISNAFFSPIWLTTGAALAAIFLRGNFLLVGIFLGTLIGYLVNHLPWNISLTLSLMFVIYIYLIRKLAFLTIGPIAPIFNNAVLWKFYGLIAILSAVYSYLFFTLIGLNAGVAFFFFVFTGWLAQINGILCITLICLLFDPYAMYRHFHKVQLWSILAMVIVLCHLFYFVVPAGIPTIVLSILFLAILCGYAKYFGKIPTCATLLAIAVIYLGGIIPPSHLFHADSSALQVMITLALFTLTAMLSISVATLTRTDTFKS